MALTKYKIGELVQLIDERNNIGLRNFYGINIDKEFMPTVASTDLLDETKYKVVRKNRFVYSGMQTGRDKCIRISLYSDDTPIIVSPAYITFEIKVPNIIIPQFFFMLFLSKEKDRLGWFYSDGSIRSNLDWDVFCDIELKLPSIEVQQKYVGIYNAMVANQKAYEKGLGDLKLVCDGFIEDLRRKLSCEKIGKYIEQVTQNNAGLKVNLVQGVESSGCFIKTRAKMQGVDIENYTVVQRGCIAYNPSRINLGSIALYRDIIPCVVSPMYEVFKIKNEEKLFSEYLMLWFQRNEFYRYTWFFAQGSVRDTFDFELMQEVCIPIPDIKIQQSIVDIYNQYIIRKEMNEKLKAQIKDLCPVLIKGSLQEAK